jgi:hypothetical protein
MGCKIGKFEFGANPTGSLTPAAGCSPEWQSDEVSTKLSGVDQAHAYDVVKSVAGAIGTVDLDDGSTYVRVDAQGMKFNISLEATIVDLKVTVKGSWPEEKSALGRNVMNEIRRKIVERLSPQESY